MSTQKRTLSTLENGDAERGNLPSKKLRTEDYYTGPSGEHPKNVDSPAQIDEGEFGDEEGTSIQKVDVPVVEDLYLETVSSFPCSDLRLKEDIGEPVHARI